MRRLIFWKSYKPTLGVLYTYDDIRLKTYFDIANSGNITLLVKEGSCPLDKCLEAWEEIIRRQEQATGSYKYNSLITLLNGYRNLKMDQLYIRALLLKCTIALDFEAILKLRQKGYDIDTRPEYVEQSLKNALIRCTNLKTKAEMKRKEINRLFEVKKTDKKEKQKSFEEIMGNLTISLGSLNILVVVDDSITLARYNYYQKTISERVANSKTSKPTDYYGRNK